MAPKAFRFDSALKMDRENGPIQASGVDFRDRRRKRVRERGRCQGHGEYEVSRVRAEVDSKVYAQGAGPIT